jgi:hypothetical protein
MDPPPDFNSGPGGSGQSPFSGQLPSGADLAPSASGLRMANLYDFAGGAQLPFDLAPAPKKSQSRNKQPKAKVLPAELDIDGPSSNAEYQAALSDGSIAFSPQALGFLPSNYWLAVDVTFGDLVTKFFQRKNNANCRFPHKLYNALVIVERDPAAFNLFGVEWITDQIFKVDKLIFARLLGIGAVDGGLFHRQGNFPSHGFAELTGQEIDPLRAIHDLSDVDQDRVRLMYHRSSGFAKGSNEEAVTRCKWITEGEPRQ